MIEIENKIRNILKKLPSESNKLDYKAIDYSNLQMADFIKDIIAFLNSDESYEEDKYIILGVTNNKHICGLKNPVRDDNEYQNLVNFISPRPDISTGSFNYNGDNIGYIFIPGKNKDQVYEVIKDYKSSDNNFVCIGQSCIRKGTSNYPMTSKERERIYYEKLIQGDLNKNDVVQAIAAKTELQEDRYINKSEESTVEFKCKNNNGLFTVGKGKRTFQLQWYVVNNDVAHIRVGNNEEIGYKDNYTEWLPRTKISNYNFSSFDRRIEKEESFVLVNKLGKILGVKLILASSKSHGAIEDVVRFQYKCLN